MNSSLSNYEVTHVTSGGTCEAVRSVIRIPSGDLTLESATCAQIQCVFKHHTPANSMKARDGAQAAGAPWSVVEPRSVNPRSLPLAVCLATSAHSCSINDSRRLFLSCSPVIMCTHRAKSPRTRGFLQTVGYFQRGFHRFFAHNLPDSLRPTEPARSLG